MTRFRLYIDNNSPYNPGKSYRWEGAIDYIYKVLPESTFAWDASACVHSRAVSTITCGEVANPEPVDIDSLVAAMRLAGHFVEVCYG